MARKAESRPALASTDPAAYVALLMFERPEENFYSKGSESWVPI
jgi:hypothetical protein